MTIEEQERRRAVEWDLGLWGAVCLLGLSFAFGLVAVLLARPWGMHRHGTRTGTGAAKHA